MSRPVVVVGNQSRYKSRPLNSTRESIAGVYDLLLNLLREISYVSTRSEQIANANLSLNEAFNTPLRTKIAIFLLLLHYRAYLSQVTKVTTCHRKASSHLMSFFEKGENFLKLAARFR